MKSIKYLSTLFLTIMLATVLGCASTPKQEGTGEYIDDSVITTKVKAAIFNEPSLKSSEINVETFKGMVQLSGFVNSAADISKALEVARSINGVKSVKDDPCRCLAVRFGLDGLHVDVQSSKSLS